MDGVVAESEIAAAVERDGFAIARNVLSQNEVASVIALIEAIPRRNAGRDGARAETPGGCGT